MKAKDNYEKRILNLDGSWGNQYALSGNSVYKFSQHLGEVFTNPLEMTKFNAHRPVEILKEIKEQQTEDEMDAVNLYKMQNLLLRK